MPGIPRVEVKPTMTDEVAQLEARIRLLAPDQQAELIRGLIAEWDSPADPDVERAWLEEAQRRYREIVEGKMQAIPAEQVFEKLRRRLRREA
jgi:putative addiction module component (TIGR02574 family)